MYLVLIGTERCIVMLLLSACGCACVWCGGDGCVGDTTNACTMYRVMGVRLAGSVYVVDRLMYCKPFILYTQCNSFN